MGVIRGGGKHPVSFKCPAELHQQYAAIAADRGLDVTSLLVLAAYFYLPRLLAEEKARREEMDAAAPKAA